jgi:hypothetical protein
LDRRSGQLPFDQGAEELETGETDRRCRRGDRIVELDRSSALAGHAGRVPESAAAHQPSRPARHNTERRRRSAL